jgi:hypothetical protein
MRDFQLGEHIHLIGVSQIGRWELATSFDFGSGARGRAVASVSRGYHASGWAVQSSTCANVARLLASSATAQRNLFGRRPGPRQGPAPPFLPMGADIWPVSVLQFVSVSEQMPTGLTEKVREVAARLEKSERTVWRWVGQGCDLASERSIREFAAWKRLRKTNVQKAREKLEAAFTVSNGSRASGEAQFEDLFSGKLPPLGRRGAAAALERLGEAEERAHARMLVAMERGSLYQIEALQDFWLKCSETLRKLDLAVEMARRDAEEQVPKKLAESIALNISEWLRIAFAQFLSSEARSLMGIKDLGEFKSYSLERFKGILDLTVKSSLQTRSAIPDWAAEKVREAWNVY